MDKNGQKIFLKISDVNRPAKSARPGLGRFVPSRFSQPGQAGPDLKIVCFMFLMHVFVLLACFVHFSQI